MPDLVSSRLLAFARDRNIDVEDIQQVLDAALADGLLSGTESGVLRAALSSDAANFEPQARRYLEAALAGTAVKLPNRVLLAPHPKGAQRELYYSRNDAVQLQEALVNLSFPTGVDGDYGPGTTAMVKRFQESVQLPGTGVVDSVTLAALNRALEARNKPALDLSPRAHIRPDKVLALRHGMNVADNRAIQEGLARLGQHFLMPVLKVAATGSFDGATESAVKAFQARAFLPSTGIVDESTLDALNAALTAVGLAPVVLKPSPAGAGFGGQVELHFYPGDAERKVYVLKQGRMLDSYGMVGGEATGRDDPRNPHVDYSPSPKGDYDVVEVSPHASYAWNWSYVPYGAPLREQGGQVEFQDDRGRWHVATGPNSEFKDRLPPPLERKDYLGPDGKLLPEWTKNDFGHLRGRLKSVRTGTLQGHMIHSSAFNQGTDTYYADTDRLLDPKEALSVLHVSHGCEHIHPRDLDELVARGYLAPGTRFVVHGYDERYSGPRVA